MFSTNNAEKSRNNRSVKKQKITQKAPSFSEPAAFVTFLIGEGDNPTKFLVHKEFACHYSPVLKAAFNSEFVEGQTQTYWIDNTTERAFRLLIQWLYSHKFDHMLGDCNAHGGIVTLLVEFSEFLPTLADEDMSLAELWVLADKLCVPALQNLIIDTIYKICITRDLATTPTFHYIYKNTESGSLLRRLAVLQTTCLLDDENVVSASGFFPRVMLVNFSAFLLHRQTKMTFHHPADLSDYHVPLDGTSA